MGPELLSEEMKKARANLIAFLGTLAVGSVCASFGSTIPFRDQWPLFEALRTTSAIIFAVIGAWVSVLYPNALQKIFKRGESFDARDSESIHLMLANIRLSSLVIGSLLIVGVAAPILRQFQVLLDHIEMVRALSFGALGALTFIQLWTLLMTLAQAEIAKEDLDRGRQRKLTADHLLRDVKKLDPSAAEKRVSNGEQ